MRTFMETKAPLEMTIVLTSQLRTSAAHIDLFSIQQLGVCWSFHVRQGSTITEVVYILYRGLKMDKQQLNYDFFLVQLALTNIISRLLVKSFAREPFSSDLIRYDLVCYCWISKKVMW